MKKSPALFERDTRKLYSIPMEIHFDLANEWVFINGNKNGKGNFARDKSFFNDNNNNKRP